MSDDSQAAYYTRKPNSPYKMRPSRVLRQIRAGKVATCIKSNLADPRIIEIFASTGFDSVWLCTEHCPSNYGDLGNSVLAAKVHDVDTILRVPRGSYTDYIRGFEMDAAGLMVPHVMSAADAANVVEMTKFPPLGRRAVDGGNADALYCRVGIDEYLKVANEERFVIHQIEDPEPLEELEAIAELPGVDMLFFGPGDFSVSIGHPGELDHPEVTAARKRVAEVARKNGKIAGTVGISGEHLADFVDMGYNFLHLGGDVTSLCRAAEEAYNTLSKVND